MNPTFNELIRDYMHCGTLLVRRSRMVGEDLTAGNQIQAQIYEHAILAYLRLVGGSCTMWDLFNESEGGLGLKEIPMYLAVHSLRAKGLVEAEDPYGPHVPTFMDEHRIRYVGPLPGIQILLPDAIPSRWLHAVAYQVRHELTQYRRKVCQG